MSRFAFVFYVTQWRPDLYRPLEACLYSLDTRGGAAAGYDRYLVYAESLTDEMRHFCERGRLIPRHERRFTYQLSYPNKATMLLIPEYDAVALTDLDILFLGDPTPMFEHVATEGKIHTRYDIIVPLWPWPSLPPRLARRLRWQVAPRLWRAQYGRFASRNPTPPREMPWEECGSLPAYFNDGVVFAPGKLMRPLHDAWKAVALAWLRDVRWRRPYTRFFTNHFTSQISYSIALHRGALPWDALPSTHNLIPAEVMPAADRALLSGEDLVMAHLVSGVRHWLEPGAAPNCPEWMLPLFHRVQEVVSEIPAGGERP